jgi:probable FeS assembly SUF system protein SufT
MSSGLFQNLNPGTPLLREVQTVAIPSGERGKLLEGTRVRILHARGGDFTVATFDGAMFRIEGRDADALGLERPEPAAAPGALAGAEGAGAPSLQDQVWAQLRTCYDPEIPVDIVELGLVYKCEIADRPEGDKKVSIAMTLTAPGCGMGQVLADDVKRKVLSIPGIVEADVQVVFDPPWDPSKMSEAARLELGMY